MLLQEIAIQRTEPTPLKVDSPLVHSVFNMADEVEGALVDTYRKTHNAQHLNYAQVIKLAREKYGKIMNVPLNAIIGSEEKLYRDQLVALQKKTAQSSSILPLLYKHNNKYIVADGNHRIAAAKLEKKRSIQALVLDLDLLVKSIAELG